ncbi:MAG: hypothetical protein H7Z72_25190 [Bacteroidetes bacterium]|nr:hypothetical protein [Fibrella sp.]
MNDLFSQLPEYDPHPDLWARIEADLDSDVTLARVVGELPDYEPQADLWTAIDAHLTQPSMMPVTPGTQPVVVRPLWHQPLTRRLWAGMAAAAMIVLVGAWLKGWPTSTEAVRMEYAVEQTTETPNRDAVSETSGADERAEAFIARQCAEQQLACQQPEVHTLRNQLADLTTEQKRIDRERLTFGDDPALVRAQVKIENQRAEVTKELITLLRS